jgi:hypothetical protein
VGVGFSYSDNTADYTTGDAQAAADMYSAVVAFFERFSSYKGSEFYYRCDLESMKLPPIKLNYISLFVYSRHKLISNMFFILQHITPHVVRRVMVDITFPPPPNTSLNRCRASYTHLYTHTNTLYSFSFSLFFFLLSLFKCSIDLLFPFTVVFPKKKGTAAEYNFKGFFLGNPWTDVNANYYGRVQVWLIC